MAYLKKLITVLRYHSRPQHGTKAKRPMFEVCFPIPCTRGHVDAVL